MTTVQTVQTIDLAAAVEAGDSVVNRWLAAVDSIVGKGAYAFAGLRYEWLRAPCPDAGDEDPLAFDLGVRVDMPGGWDRCHDLHGEVWWHVWTGGDFASWPEAREWRDTQPGPPLVQHDPWPCHMHESTLTVTVASRAYGGGETTFVARGQVDRRLPPNDEGEVWVERLTDPLYHRLRGIVMQREALRAAGASDPAMRSRDKVFQGWLDRRVTCTRCGREWEDLPGDMCWWVGDDAACEACVTDAERNRAIQARW